MNGITNKGMYVQEFVYDFAVDGGVKDVAIVLSAKATKEPLPVGAVVKAITAKVLTACTSGGSATVEWGNGDDQNGYSGTAIAVASLTLLALFNGWDNAAALIWDDTDDHPIPLNISTALDGQMSLLINVADLTAGKIVFMVEYVYPSVVA